MKKIYGLILVMLLTAGMMVGCNDTSKEGTKEKQQTNHTENQAFPITIKDATGEKVTIEEQPKKIVTLIPSNTEVVFALGLGKKVVGVSDNDNYPEETKEIEKVGGMEMNTELIVSLKPDLVLAHASSAHNSNEGLQQLKDAGIDVLVVNDAQSFDEVYESIDMIGQATGEHDKAKEIVANMKTKLKKIQEKAKSVKDEERKTVLVEVSPSPDIYTPGKNTFMNEMLNIISAKNAAAELDGWAKIDEESMIAANPDVIITTYGYYTKDPISEVTGRKGWEDVAAVKDGQVFDVHSDLVTRSGPRLIEGVEELAKSVYPNLFDN
ncbi:MULTISPECIES: ABC transporter substrate-binding protein [unclassified Peribacillus]|uniref:ABC transporter substrate-binding protein n=1 Tax=unclassified Peribacillus TaxID=2675266 RepID=UPI00191348B1|nr:MULTISPECIES: ABC transporter substrate-binding protein [unclassified Peribacillus]MBK5499267.1 ABC transporter substrate-binding protein [Peribacillus sp. TH14]WMX55632.1 ABC transporter substrate-binding protein [Peribacillus sp. R9-11]